MQPLDPVYNEALKREIDKIAAALPHDEIAIQFDVASAVFARLQRNEPNAYGKDRAEMLATLLRDPDRPRPSTCRPTSSCMFHFCYGDSNHKHVVEPTDMGDMVDDGQPARGRHQTADRAHPHAGAARPRRRRLFRAAQAAAAQARNRIMPRPGALHRRRRRHAPAAGRRRAPCRGDFSIATECGFGRRDPKTIPELLRIHAEIAG